MGVIHISEGLERILWCFTHILFTKSIMFLHRQNVLFIFCILATHQFFRYPNPRIPSASILAKKSESQPRWRGNPTGGTREHFWRNKRRRKFALEYENMPQRYEELCEFSVRLVEHEENMPRNYVRFHIPREMTKYELYNYLGTVLMLIGRKTKRHV